MTVENFVRILWTVFEKIEKSRKMAVFWTFLANFGIFLTSQPCNFDAIAHIGL